MEATIDQIEKFEANFGGTEISAPLLDIIKVDKEMKQNKEVASGKLGSSLTNQWKGRRGFNKIWRFVISTHLAHNSCKSRQRSGVI